MIKKIKRYEQWVVLFRKMKSHNCNGVCKLALFNLYVHTIAVV